MSETIEQLDVNKVIEPTKAPDDKTTVVEGSVPNAAPVLGTAPVAITSVEQLRTALANAPGTVLLDFLAKDCAACEAEAPELAKLAACAGTTVLQVDVDALPEIADAMKADGTPTLYMGKGSDFLADLDAGNAALEAEKRVPRPKHVKEVEPGDKLLRRLKCAR